MDYYRSNQSFTTHCLQKKEDSFSVAWMFYIYVTEGQAGQLPTNILSLGERWLLCADKPVFVQRDTRW